MHKSNAELTFNQHVSGYLEYYVTEGVANHLDLFRLLIPALFESSGHSLQKNH